MSQLNSILALKLQRQQVQEQQAREDNMRADASVQAAMEKLITGQQQLAQQSMAQQQIELNTLKAQQNMEIARQKQAIENRKWELAQKTPEEREAALSRTKAQTALAEDRLENPTRHMKPDIIGQAYLRDKRIKHKGTSVRTQGTTAAKNIKARVAKIAAAMTMEGSRGGRLEALAGTRVIPDVKVKVAKMTRMATRLDNLAAAAGGTYDREEIKRAEAEILKLSREFAGIVPEDPGGDVGGGGATLDAQIGDVLKYMGD